MCQVNSVQFICIALY